MFSRNQFCLIAVSTLVLAGMTTVSAEDSPSSTAPSAEFTASFLDRHPCQGEFVSFRAKDTRASLTHAWYLNGARDPNGPNLTALNFTIPGVGSFSVRHDVYQASSAGTTSNAPATKSLEFASIDCEKEGTTNSTVSPKPSEPTQPGNTYDSEKCRALQEDANRFKTDWSYRYQMATEAEDAEKMRSLEAERDSYMSSWQEQWRAAGCDYANAPDGGCNDVYMELKMTIEEFHARIQEIWSSHWHALEAARKEFAAEGYHNDDDWHMFEDKWRRISSEIEARVKAEVEAFMSNHPRLAECGYQHYSGATSVTDYKEQYGTTPAVSQDPYWAARTDCEDKIIAIKKEYAARFEDLYRRLMEFPADSPEYAGMKQQLAELEMQVRQRVETLMQECRQNFQEDYRPAENYKDGAGGLYCFFDESLQQIACKGKYVSFNGDPQTQVLSRFSCGGQLFFDQVYSNTVFEDFQFEETGDGGALRIRSSNLKIILHDSPRGVVNVGLVGDAQMYFVPAIHLDVVIEGNRVLMEGADSRGMWLGGEDAFVWDEASRTLTVRGEATWVAESCLPDGSKPDGASDAQYWDAIRERRLGAQVIISLDGGDDEVDQDNETYDEGMDVEVRREGARYRAIIDSAGGDCKTVVLKFDTEIFSTVKLKVTLTDENDTTLTIQEADNIEDVLDPCDDGEDGFEYWIVVDKYGTQVLVSFAHFSEKRVSVEAASVGNIVIPGFDATSAAVAVGLVATAMVLVRRRLTR